MKTSLSICLAWHNFDSSNYGVGALSVAHIYVIELAAKELGISCTYSTLGSLSQDDLTVRREVEKDLNKKINHTNFSLRTTLKRFGRFNLSDLRIFDQYDIIFDIGEGDSFSDIYGKKRFLAHWLTKALTLKSKKPLVIAPQTIGPFQSKIVARMASYVLKRASLVYARDEVSAKYATELGALTRTSTDVAFSLPFQNESSIPDAVGLNVSGLMLSGGYTRSNQFGITLNYEELCVGLISEFRARQQTVYLIGHVISTLDPVEDDFRACQRIKERFSNDDAVIVANRFSSPSEAKSFISRMSFFIGSRMHSTIAALSSGVVTVPLAYSRKFAGVFGTLAYPHTLDARTLDNQAAIKRILAMFDEERPAMAAQLTVAREEADRRNAEYTHSISRVLANV